TTSSPITGPPPYWGRKFPVRLTVTTWPLVTLPSAAAILVASKDMERSRNPSGPSVVHALAPVLPMYGENGVATSWYAYFDGAMPANRIDAGSSCVTLRLAVPRIATGKVPCLPRLNGLGHDVGLMSTGTATGTAGVPSTSSEQSASSAVPAL